MKLPPMNDNVLRTVQEEIRQKTGREVTTEDIGRVSMLMGTACLLTSGLTPGEPHIRLIVTGEFASKFAFFFLADLMEAGVIDFDAAVRFMGGVEESGDISDLWGPK